MKIQPYLFFEGRTEEAAEFYKKELGAEVTLLVRFKDCPPDHQAQEQSADCTTPVSSGDKIAHMSLKIGETEILLSDGRCSGASNFQGFSLSLTAPNEVEAHRLFAGLSNGGQVLMPLAETFYSPCFGMTSDRFGVLWMIIVEPKQ